MVSRENCASTMEPRRGHLSLQPLTTLSQPSLVECTAHLPVPCQGARFIMTAKHIAQPSMAALLASAKPFALSQSQFTTTLLSLPILVKLPSEHLEIIPLD